jgi:hypothetical protein
MPTKMTSPNSYREDIKNISFISTPTLPKSHFPKKEVTYVTDVPDVTFLSFFRKGGRGRRSGATSPDDGQGREE